MLLRLPAFCALLLGGLASAAMAAPPVDPILEWNLIAIDAGAVDHSQPAKEQGGPCKTARALAIVHVAMYDAFNSIDGSNFPYLISIPLGKDSSVDAAVGQAAHDTLVALYPNQTASFDAALTTTLARAKKLSTRLKGQVIGKAVAKAILTNRAGDGSDTSTPYVPGDQPGEHREDPLHPGQGFYVPGWGGCKPFGITAEDDFQIPPPPALDSPEYAVAFNEVKLLGERNSVTRTAEQTITGIFWGYDGTKGLGAPPRLYNQVARVIAVDKKNTVAQNARLFALINIGQADAGMCAWNDKYRYNFWRPVLGVREADAGTGPSGLGDDNPDTEGDIDWEPLGAPASNQSGTDFTPPFPAYASGHATFGASLFQTLRQFYGTDQIAFSFTSDEYNGVTTDSQGNVRPVVTRNYPNLTVPELENAASRIYLGVHWRFDATAGTQQGTAIATRIFATKLRPKK
ncbi:MAG TPA: phosphatase PAP2 family protein [Planctomycetaceae bacterium]|nr:phosphatase PAP2 family protein [Planctomycetaceae bacterium]